MARVARDTAHPYAAPQRPSLRLVGGARGVPATVAVRATLVADLLDELRAAGMPTGLMWRCTSRRALIVRGSRYANPKGAA